MKPKDMLRAVIRELVKEAQEPDLDAELNTVEVGDKVDVEMDALGTLPVRVLKMVPDVRREVSMHPDKNEHPSDESFKGPGFVGEIDPASGESGTLVFALKQVLPGSKMKYYFPELGETEPWLQGKYGPYDDFGRKVKNPYKKMAKKFANDAISLPHHGSANYMDEGDSDENAEDVKRDVHADPTGRLWDRGLEEAHTRTKRNPENYGVVTDWGWKHVPWPQFVQQYPEAAAAYVENYTRDWDDESIAEFGDPDPLKWEALWDDELFVTPDGMLVALANITGPGGSLEVAYQNGEWDEVLFDDEGNLESNEF